MPTPDLPPVGTLSPSPITADNSRAPRVNVERNPEFPELSISTANRFAWLHRTLEMPRVDIFGDLTMVPAEVRQEAERFKLGGNFSRVYIEDFLLPHMKLHQETHGLLDPNEQHYSRTDFIGEIQKEPALDRYGWCNDAICRTIHSLSDHAGKIYRTAAGLLNAGMRIEFIRSELSELSPFASRLTHEKIQKYSDANKLIKTSYLADLLPSMNPDKITVFNIIPIGLNTERNFALALLKLLPISFEQQVGRTMQLAEWDALSFDLLRAVKATSLTHGDLLPYFRGSKDQKSKDDPRMPQLPIRTDDILIGHRKGLLKVEIGNRLFLFAAEKKKGTTFDPRLGCAGHLAIPKVYRWIRGIVRDAIVEPQLRV